MVLDSKLPEHLSHFGIDMMTMEKASSCSVCRFQWKHNIIILFYFSLTFVIINLPISSVALLLKLLYTEVLFRYLCQSCQIYWIFFYLANV